MDFAIPETLRPLLERARRFVDDHVIPAERELLGGGSFAAAEPTLRELRARVQAEGMWLPQLPREWGGLGLGLLEHGLLSEVLGRSPVGHYVFGCQAPDAGNMEILIHFGTPAQQDRWLKPLLRGEQRSCFSMTEPEQAGSNPVWLGTTARRDGDEWVVDGRKWFTTGADGAAFAIVMAVTKPDAAPHLRASMVIVPTDTPGFERIRNISIMGEPGDGWASHSEIAYRGCRVPADHLLGADGAGFLIAQARLGPGRIHHCMRWLGICERAFELMVQRAATRELGPDYVLGQKQTVQNWIADARAQIDAAKLLVLRTAWLIERSDMRQAKAEISAIKFFVADVMLQTIDRAIQTHGALGITDDTVLAWWYRHERGARIYDGPDEVHRAVVAKEHLSRAGLRVRGSDGGRRREGGE
jgi:alkylation response protein AidB-like acyl-CoA dehydrogenase